MPNLRLIKKIEAYKYFKQAMAYNFIKEIMLIWS